MPQLDFTITFPQIFWLLIIFTTVYSILVHFFLPNFIKLNKSRKDIVSTNQNTTILLKNSFDKKQLFIEGIIRSNFFELKSVLEKEFPSLLFNKTKITLEFFDFKLASVLYYNTLYYDATILNSVPLKPNFLKSKF